MNKREIITYLRITESGSVPVDKENRAVTSNKYPTISFTERPMLRMRPLHDDGKPYTKADFSDYVSFEFGIDNDWDRNTTPKVHAVSGKDEFTVAEVTIDDITYVEISVELNGNSIPFGELFKPQERRILNGVYAELSAFNTGSTLPDFIIQFPFILGNKLLDVNSASPDEPIDNFYTVAQMQALFAEYYKIIEIDALISAVQDQIETNISNIDAIGLELVTVRNELAVTAQKTAANASSLNLIADELEQIQNSLSNKIDEAPKDGNQYARKNGAWFVVTGGGGIDPNAVYHKGELVYHQDKLLIYEQVPYYVYHNDKLLHHNNKIVFNQ